jgi:TonB family protein
VIYSLISASKVPFFFAGMAASCLFVRAMAQDLPPVVERQIQPVWASDLEKDYLVENAKVELIIDNHGVPFSLSTTSGLPDNVVESLAKWRFHPGKRDGKDGASSVVLNVPVRSALTPASERAMRRRWFPATRELDEAIKTGFGLDAADLAGLERVLVADAQSVNSRATLLAYAATKQLAAQPEEAWKARAKHIAWLSENQPAAPILGSPLATLSCAGALVDRAGCERVRAAWSNYLASHPSDPVILEHASNVLRLADPAQVEAILQPTVSKIDRSGIWLGDLYGLAALGATTIDPKTGVVSAASDKVPDDPFARKSRSALGRATDIHVVFAGLAVITTGGRSLAKSGHLPDGYPELCDAVLKHARDLYAGSVATCSISADDPLDTTVLDTAAIERIRVGGNVQAAALTKRVQPSYPTEAKSRGIQGTVQFTAVIDKQGKIKSLVLLSGPFALYKSARDAVSQWEYRPTQLNGHPVEVITRLDVNYQLAGR